MEAKFMKKLLILLILISSCTYKPVVDTAGRSGTFPESKAENVTNDIILCRKLALQHMNKGREGFAYVYNYYLRIGTLFLTPKMEYEFKQIQQNCLKNRGHSLLK
jgi:hypothetical protein